MKQIQPLRILFTLLVVFLAFTMTAGAEEQDDPATSAETAQYTGLDELLPEKAYIIGPGDIIEISVWKDASLTKVLPVIPDGTIAFPLIGQLVAAGKTLSRLRREIVERLAAYVPEPVLSVSIHQVNSLAVYVIGKVKRPGRFGLTSEINVLQALSLAGGLDPFAKSGRIKIFRLAGNTTETIPFDYDDVVSGKHPQQNIMLERGDVIVVP